MGELVAAEEPVLVVPAEGWRESVREQFRALPSNAREAVLALHDARVAEGQPGTLEGVVRTNVFSVEETSTAGAVCTVLSRFNHSCVPNCEASWCARTGKQQIYASTRIRAGDELCIYYTDVRAPRAQRRLELCERYGFLCSCRACRTASTQSDERRSQMQHLDMEIGRVSARDPSRGMKLGLELLDAYDAEGLCTQNFRKRACYYMFQLCLMTGNSAEALRWVRQAHQHAACCHGPAHADTLRLRQYLKDPRSHPAWSAAGKS